MYKNTTVSEFAMGNVNYGDLLMEIMVKSPPVFALDADLISASGARKAWVDFPERFVNVGIAESNMMGIAAGLSMTGFVPFVHTFAAFATRRTFDQIYLSCAYADNNVKIFGSDGGFNIGVNGGTHTSYEDLALMRLLPNVVVSEACDATQLRWTMNEILGKHGVHYTRVFRRPVRNIYTPESTFEFGKGNVIRSGHDATIIACGLMVYEAILAADILANKGYHIGVVDMFTIKPIDSQLIKEIASTCKIIVTAENHNIIGGLGSAVAEVLAELGFGTILRRIGCQDRFGQVGSIDFLQKEYGMLADDIVRVLEIQLAK
jgi:transketolase